MSDHHSDQDMDLGDLSPNEKKLLDRSDYFTTTINIKSAAVDDDAEDYDIRRTVTAANDMERWRRERESEEPKDENLESQEEEHIIRLPSENDITEASLVQHSINSNCYQTLSQTSPKSADCLNFTQQDRELAYLKHAEIFENWKYSDEERAFLRHRVETFSREQCIIHCILGHMLMTPDEMYGVRQSGLKPEDARQALLSLAIGSHWDVYNLAIIMAFSEKLNVDSCVNRMYQGVDPMFASSIDFRSRVTLYFARCLLDE